MKVTINEREYELKELTKEQARAYIGKEVYVWEKKNPVKRKLLEVFEPLSDFFFCVLSDSGRSVSNYSHCAPVPEEWYVYDLGEGVEGTRYCITTTPRSFGVADHGSFEYCKQKAKELNEREETEHCLTNYELAQLMKCFGVEWKSKDTAFTNNDWGYISGTENEVPKHDGLKIRFKYEDWMPATRETVLKWWCRESSKSNMSEFVSVMGWDKKFYYEKYNSNIPLECISPTPDEIGG